MQGAHNLQISKRGGDFGIEMNCLHIGSPVDLLGERHINGLWNFSYRHFGAAVIV